MTPTLPLILAGPMLRHCDATHFTLWFVSREPLTELMLRLGEHEFPLQDADVHYVPLGQHAHQYLIMLSRPELLTPNRVTNYQVSASQHGDIFANISQLNYGDASSPSVRFTPELTQVLPRSYRDEWRSSLYR